MPRPVVDPVVAGSTHPATGSGSFTFIPRGTEHCFRNMGEEPARLLVLFTPWGMERFFEDFAKLPPGPPSLQAFRDAGYGAWMEVVGPPLAQLDAR